MIGQLAVEAEFRDMKLGDLVSRLITAMAKQDLFRLVPEEVPNEQSCASSQH
jgi:hypothetical protein